MTTKLTPHDFWKISFKLFFGIASLIIVVYSLIAGLLDLNVHYNPKTGKTTDPSFNNYFQQDWIVYTSQFFSYFTIQSYLLCVFFWLLAVPLHRKENKIKILNHHVIIAVAIYITITCIIFNAVLLPQTILSGTVISPINWFYLMWEHVVVPVTFVVYALFLFTNRRTVQSYRNLNKKIVFLEIIYPFCYMLYGFASGYLIKAEITRSGKTFGNKSFFDYFFLDVSKTTFGLHGYVWLIIIFFGVVSIIFAFTNLYNCITNKIIKRQGLAVTKS